MFENDVWKQVTRTSILGFYEKEHIAGRDIKQKKLIMIWTFKRKRYPDIILDKYKA